ncbi:MAG: 50S ribosomal protein L22, partial [Chloroflexi bacterium]|nr:50S ribosomal protein L22 [Chloroflexota bacterium]
GLARDELFISRIWADEGPTLKRGRAGARGRFKPILKRSSHITVVVAEKEA